MNRFARRLVVYLGLLISLYALRGLAISGNARLTEFLISSARSAGLMLELKNPAFALPIAQTADQATIGYPIGIVPLIFTLESVRVALKPTAWFLLQQRLELRATAYGGQILATVTSSLLGNSPALHVNGGEFQLGQYPLLALSGLSGQAKMIFDSELEQPKESPSPGPSLRLSASNPLLVKHSRLRLTVDELNYGGGHKIQGLLPLPPVSNLTLVGNIDQRGQLIKLTTFRISSSLGTLRGDGSATVSNGDRSSDLVLERLSLRFVLNLTSTGAGALSPYLTMAAQSQVKPDHRQWQLSVEKRSSSSPLQYTVLPIGAE